MRIRTLLKFGLIFTILILALGKIFVFLKSDMFKISQIEINGDYYISNPGLIDVIKDFEGKNIWYINVKKIEEYVHEDIRVKSLTLKKILPDTLIVNIQERHPYACLLYTSDAADDTPCVDLGGRRIIKKKTTITLQYNTIVYHISQIQYDH
eukprot:TRINITY_DN32147_c0_g1_i2.p1 TRINITY_DN32147_c0_g1~~TRINITY_DN32147_c0_g1_i2.p1  ORF type:complete len:165 (-),score=21.55 TRINITY_DN32147_c0_g1_i2:13-468(-)